VTLGRSVGRSVGSLRGISATQWPSCTGAGTDGHAARPSLPARSSLAGTSATAWPVFPPSNQWVAGRTGRRPVGAWGRLGCVGSRLTALRPVICARRRQMTGRGPSFGHLLRTRAVAGSDEGGEAIPRSDSATIRCRARLMRARGADVRTRRRGRPRCMGCNQRRTRVAPGALCLTTCNARHLGMPSLAFRLTRCDPTTSTPPPSIDERAGCPGR
jgi:hypothetical protein